MFLFSIILVVLTLAYFLLGVLGQRVACDPLRDPADSELVDLVNKLVNFKEALGVDVNVTSVIVECNKGESIYNVLRLEDKFDLKQIEDIWTRYKIDEQLEELKDQLTNAHGLNTIELLSQASKEALEKLRQAKFSEIPFEKYVDEMKRNFTNVDLEDIQVRLAELLKLAESNEQLNPIYNELRLNELHFRTYQEKIVIPMKEKAKQVIVSIGRQDFFLYSFNVYHYFFLPHKIFLA